MKQNDTILSAALRSLWLFSFRTDSNPKLRSHSIDAALRLCFFVLFVNNCYELRLVCWRPFQSSHFDARMGSKMARLQKRSKTALFRVLCFGRVFGCLRSKSRYKTKLDPLASIFDGSPRAAFRFALRTTKKPTIIASSSLSPVVARRSAPPWVKLFFCG